MSSYLFSFSGGIVILFSLIGWGSAVNRVLFPKDRIDWGQKAAWGVAFSIFVGGILNVTWTISRATILVYLGAGLLYCLFDILRTKRSDIGSLFNRIDDYRKDKIVVVGTFVVFFLALLQYGGWVSTRAFEGRDPSHAFNWGDDFHAYCVFPEKMIQAGSMGPDPFSERRLVSSLGGHYFLHTFILSMLSMKNLNIIDPGLGMIIAIGLLLGYFKNKGTPKRAAVFVLIFLLLIPMLKLKVNITALMIPLALFLSFFRTLDWEGLRTGRFTANAFIIALLSAAICSSKSNLIPACGILFILSYFFHIIESKTKKIATYEFFIATILVGVFLLPWMISMYQSSGTLLYPLFGKGYHGAVYGGAYLLPWAGLTISKGIRTLLYYLSGAYVVSLMLLSFISFISRPAKPTGRKASLSFLISGVLGTLMMLIITRLPSPRHYFAFLFSTILVLMITALSNTKEKDNSSFKNYTTVFTTILVAGIIIGNNWSYLQWYSPRSLYSNNIRSIKVGMANAPLISNEKVLRYTNMQRSIPQGETVLTRLAYPFLLDFKRNRIFIADWPGGASLPPGMPSFKGAEVLADYLTSKSIRYVAYSYANEANFRWKLYGKRINHSSNQIRTTARHTFDFQYNLKQLGKTRKRIYDDGHRFVLDLLNRRGQK